ncbi:ATP-binding protein [Streptomyces sp. NPDC050703]|uniref:ATP-binding protein n=1 Tax=Streptomyces sp. NPDC050703 TaxID=3157218 RepID=UPI003418C4C3
MGVRTDDENRAGHDVRLHASHAMAGDAGCIAEARHFATDFLREAGAVHDVPVSSRAMDLTQLVVSELVTNALKYAPGPVLMDLRVSDGSVEVAVWDSDPTVPAAREADPGRIGQHGLEIVTRIAEHLSVRRESVGKRVTARLLL